jgi:hypothetical protein
MIYPICFFLIILILTTPIEQLKMSSELFLDPITFSIMKEPHIFNCGHSLSKSSVDAILADAKKNNKTPLCPICRKNINISAIVKNFTLAKIIEEHNSKTDLKKQEKQIEILTNEEKKISDSIGDIDVFKASIKTHNWNKFTMISIEIPDGKMTISNDNVLCIDVSGSMDEGVKRLGEDGEEVDDGLSTLDVVKHAACTTVKSANSTDRIGIVTFSTDSKTLLGMTLMNEEGKEKAVKIINDMCTEGQTNIMAGITRSFDLIRSIPADTNRSSHVCLFTDGMPSENLSPSKGFKKAIGKYFDDWPTFHCCLNMLGFGYKLDSKCLDEDTRQQTNGGTYSFIPDGTLVGTIFSHLSASMQVNVGSNTVLKLEFENESDVKKVMNNDECDIDTCYRTGITGKQISIKLGNINYGQNRNVCIPSDVKLVSATLTYINNQTHKPDEITQYIVNEDTKDVKVNVKIIEQLKAQLFRQIITSSIRKAMNYMSIGDSKSAIKKVNDAYEQIKTLGYDKRTECSEIVKDFGQINEAFSSKQAYDRWGKHYLPSLIDAHISQRCNNFKDPGVQSLGGNLFRSTRDKIDEIFATLPTPKPSRKIIDNRGQYANASRLASMSTYSSSSAPCFRGDGLVLMTNGETKRVDKIVSGDVIKSYKGNFDNNCTDEAYKVLYTIRSKCEKSRATFVNYDGLIITPTHPILIESKADWFRPIDLVTKENIFEEHCDYVYNFILESGHIMNINGINCVTLGHGFRSNYHIDHPYFGTSAIVMDLEKYTQFKSKNKSITLDTDHLIRDEVTGWVIGLNPEKILNDMI